MPQSRVVILAQVALIVLLVPSQSTAQSAQEAPIIELRVAQSARAAGFTAMEAIASKRRVYVADQILVAQDAIEQVRAHRTDTGLVLDVEFSPAAAERLVAAAKSGNGRQLAVLLKSRLASAPPIAAGSRLTGLRLQIGLELPQEFADEIVARVAARWPQ